MPKIFISYKRQDKGDVFPIVEKIRQKTGIDCWIDIEGIESGDQFQNVIIDAINNADIVAFMLSRNFIAPYKDEKTGTIDFKKQTFPEREVMYALRHNKRLVPISIDGTTVFDCNWLEFNCSGLDYVDWNDIDQQNKLFHNLKQWEGKQSDERSAIVHSYPRKSGTIMVEHHPGLACLNINVDETCIIYRFGEYVGEINKKDWGELFLRMGRHELSFVTEDNRTITEVINIPSIDYTDFIHVKFNNSNNIIDNKEEKDVSSDANYQSGKLYREPEFYVQKVQNIFVKYKNIIWLLCTLFIVLFLFIIILFF